MFQQLAAARDQNVQAETVAKWGATLELHWSQGEVLDSLQRNRWDYVVLQEQSMRPVLDQEAMFRYVRLFCSEIEVAGGRPVLFLTWAHKGTPETQTGLNRAYMAIATEMHASIAPVGIAWQNALKERPDLRLHASDGSHPSAAGSYLAACVFYSLIFHDSPERLPSRIRDPEESRQDLVNLNGSLARFLQRTAWRTVQSFKGN
jgi:hypothetical protein